MPHRRWSLAALALAPVLALAACDRLDDLFERVRGAQAPGPARFEDVPLAARALSGAVQPQDEIAALLALEPLLVAPGEIVVGAPVEAALDDAAREMGLASNFIRALRADGMEALGRLPENTMREVRARAEASAADAARAAAQDALARLGVSAAIESRPGGLLTVDLNAGASPTALALAQQGAGAAAAQEPETLQWSETDRCPRVVTQAQLEADVALAMRCAIQRLQALQRFEFVEPNYIAEHGFSSPPERQTAEDGAPAPEAPRGGMPNDPLAALQWHFRARGGEQGMSVGGAGFVPFWQANLVGSRDVRVAVLDTGVDRAHPDMANSANLAAGADFIASLDRAGDGDGVDADANDAGDRCGGAMENSYHGTHVAGTIGAATTDDRVGVAGGAWDITVIPVRVLGRCGGELADIVSAIRWAAGATSASTASGEQLTLEAPADILNLSLTIPAPCPASLQSAIDAAVANNVVVVVAAGNKAEQAARVAPANCRNVLVVAAGDARGQLAFYSNFGPEVDILAPGGDVFADSDHDGRPDGVLSTRTTQAGCYDPIDRSSTERCYYAFQQGTSMAAPHVSAALALLAAQTGLRGRQLEEALLSRALAPHPDGFAQIECARSRNATPRAPGSQTCERPSGRGALDLALALP